MSSGLKTNKQTNKNQYPQTIKIVWKRYLKAKSLTYWKQYHCFVRNDG